MNFKTFKLKDAAFDDEAGSVRAVFSTLEVVDHGKDLIRRGAFGEQKVRISSYGHMSWRGSLPVGRGKIYESGDQGIFEGKFFLSSQSGREHYETVKAMEELQEWSYSLDDIDYEFSEQNGERIRIIKRVAVSEISPVLKGESIGTHTLNIKGMTLDDNAELLLENVQEFIDRLEAVKHLREQKGKSLSAKRIEEVKELKKRLEQIITIANPETEMDSEHLSEHLKELDKIALELELRRIEHSSF